MTLNFTHPCGMINAGGGNEAPGRQGVHFVFPFSSREHVTAPCLETRLKHPGGADTSAEIEMCHYPAICNGPARRH